MKLIKNNENGIQYYTDGRPEINCFEVYGEDYKRFLTEFIPYLESKPDEEWIDVIFANSDLSKRCVIFHFLGFVGQDNPDTKTWNNLDWYEANVCFIQRAGCEVNDGNHPDYQQPTPKERSITYLKNLLEGKELTPLQMMDEYFSQCETES